VRKVNFYLVIQVTFLYEIRKGTTLDLLQELKMFIWTLQKKMQKRGIENAKEKGGRKYV